MGSGTGFVVPGRLHRLMREWAESLPEQVDVRRYPGELFSERARKGIRESWWRRWERHQQAFFTARLAGREEAAAHVGFKVPQAVLTPWDPNKRRTVAQRRDWGAAGEGK